MRLISALSFMMMARGTLAGAAMATQGTAEKPGTLSPMVGTSGRMLVRVELDTAIGRRRPSLMNETVAATVSNIRSI